MRKSRDAIFPLHSRVKEWLSRAPFSMTRPGNFTRRSLRSPTSCAEGSTGVVPLYDRVIKQCARFRNAPAGGVAPEQPARVARSGFSQFLRSFSSNALSAGCRIRPGRLRDCAWSASMARKNASSLCVCLCVCVCVCVCVMCVQFVRPVPVGRVRY